MSEAKLTAEVLEALRHTTTLDWQSHKIEILGHAPNRIGNALRLIVGALRFLLDDLDTLRAKVEAAENQRDALAAQVQRFKIRARMCAVLADRISFSPAVTITESDWLNTIHDFLRELSNEHDSAAILAERDREVRRKALEEAATRLGGVGDDREPEPSVNEIAKSLRRMAEEQNTCSDCGVILPCRPVEHREGCSMAEEPSNGD